MKSTLTFAAAAAALLCGTSAFAQASVATTTATTAATAGDGVDTQTTVAATVPTTKVVSQDGGQVSETITAAPLVTDGAVKTSTTVRAADGQDLVKTTVNADGTATTAVRADVPVKRTVKYQDGKKIVKTKSTVVTAAPVNVQTTNVTSDGQAVAVSTTAAPNGSTAPMAPVPATAGDMAMTTPASDAPMQTASADQMGAAQTAIASYDTNKDGSLNPLEFGQMVLASQAPASGEIAAANSQRYSKRAMNPATTVLNQTGGAFSKADTNGDHMISADELAAWQANGSPM